MLPLQGECSGDFNPPRCGGLAYIALSGRNTTDFTSRAIIFVAFNYNVKIDSYNFFNTKHTKFHEKDFM